METSFLEQIALLKRTFSTPRKIVIVTHKGPDGDAMGSLLGLYHFLQKQGHEVYAVTPNECPSFLKWLPHYDQVKPYTVQKSEVDGLIASADYIFNLDYNEFSRTSDAQMSLMATSAQHILVDHHQQPNIPAFILFSDVHKSATAELLFDILEAWDASQIDETLATCIYTGIMTDTGCFSYNVQAPQTFETVAKLMQYGINRNYIYSKVFDNYSESRMRLLGYCLSKKMEIFPDQHAALIVLTREEQEQFHFEVGDSEGFVNYPFSIQGIYFSVFMREEDDRIKVSLRSRGSIDVNRIARDYFMGGGHINASGGDVKLALSEVIQRFHQVLSDHGSEWQIK